MAAQRTINNQQVSNRLLMNI